MRSMTTDSDTFLANTIAQGPQCDLFAGVGERSHIAMLLSRIEVSHRQDWLATREERQYCLRMHGSRCFSHAERSAVVVMRGYAVRSDDKECTPQSEVVAEVCRYFRTHGEFPVDGYEGSFTWVGLDPSRGLVLAYRNLIGSQDTFYANCGDSLLIGSSLAELAEALEPAPVPNDAVLPALFLYRTVPGSATLFSGISRLLPGELLRYESGRLAVKQLRTLASFVGPPIGGSEAVDEIEATLARITADIAALSPTAMNLLSGGVDSCLIQAHWNRATASRGMAPQSVAVTVDHPRTRGDRDYALSAAAALRCDHTSVPAPADVAELLKQVIRTTGEPPNHVQAVFLHALACELKSMRCEAVICGEGADSLFGTDNAWRINRAARLQRVIPLPIARRMLAVGCRALGRHDFAASLELADAIGDREDVRHPFNTVAAWNHFESSESCFDRHRIDAALRDRQGLLDRYDAHASETAQCHAIGLFAEGVGTASHWTSIFENQGIKVYCPFLDSRMVRVAHNLEPAVRFNIMMPKATLRESLARHVPRDIAYRPKLSFGQPIFEWMAERGKLRSDVDAIGAHKFVPDEVLRKARANPNWFLYTLLCYDLWSKQFVQSPSISGGG